MNNRKDQIATAEAIENGVANVLGEVTDINSESYKLASIEVMNAINALPLMANIWALFQKEHKDEFLSTLFSRTTKPTVPQLTTLLYEIRDKYNLKAVPTANSTSDKAARRKARRERQKMENGENTAKERVLRGGENTLILKDANGTISRYKVRKKGAPKYKDAGIMRPVTFVDTEGKKHDVNLVLNPNAAGFKEGAKASNRVGFEWDGKWFIKDDDENYKTVVAFDEKPNKKDRPTFEILAAGTKVEVPVDENTEEPSNENQEPEADTPEIGNPSLTTEEPDTEETVEEDEEPEAEESED